MDRELEERIGRNEALLREVNEAIERGQWPAAKDRPIRFRCECARLDCNQTVEMTVSEYERVRDHPRRFVLVTGHEADEAEMVLESHPGYAVVEKRAHAGRVAERLDPRD